MNLRFLGKTVSPLVKTLMESMDANMRSPDDVLTVGQTLSILCQDFNSQISHRKFVFFKTLSNKIIFFVLIY